MSTLLAISGVFAILSIATNIELGYYSIIDYAPPKNWDATKEQSLQRGRLKAYWRSITFFIVCTVTFSVFLVQNTSPNQMLSTITLAAARMAALLILVLIILIIPIRLGKSMREKSNT